MLDKIGKLKFSIKNFLVSIESNVLKGICCFKAYFVKFLCTSFTVSVLDKSKVFFCKKVYIIQMFFGFLMFD